MQKLTASLFARADELMEHAPGHVSVRRISHIDEVQLLRSVRATLTEHERDALDPFRLELMQRLDGISTSTKASEQERTGLFGRLLGALDAAQDAITIMRPTNGSPQELPQRLPAPVELVDAAEAWLLSHICADRVDGDLGVLQQPWEQATVKPADD